MSSKPLNITDGETFENTVSRVKGNRPKPATGNMTMSPPEIYGGLSTRLSSARIIHEQVLLYGAGIPRNRFTRDLLTRLYQSKILKPEDLGPDCNWDEGVALAQLAAARFCDVDRQGIRITDRGEEYIENLVGLANQ